MVADLVRALLAAAAVGLLPGWFWARTLCGASEGLITRLLYSAALSVGLVPAVALAAARLWPGGGGITAGVALFGAFAVFLGGLLAYGRFGAPGGGEAREEEGEPGASSVGAELGYPTLVALGAAAVVALGSVWGFYEGWRAVPLVALLVLVAGVAHLLSPPRTTSRCAAPHPGQRPVERRALRILHALTLAAVSCLILARAYAGPLRHDWPFPRGVDRFEHAVMTEMMLSGGTTESFLFYPPGLHALTALLSRLSGLEPLELFAALFPALLLLPALACYSLARDVWGWEVGVAAALLAGLVTSGPYEHISHARYANIIAAQFLLVLALGALFRLYTSGAPRDGLLLALLGSSVVLYHQVASFYEATLLALVAVLVVPLVLARDRRAGLVILASFTALGLLSVLYAWDTYDLGRLLAGVLGDSGAGRGAEAVGMVFGTKAPFPPEHLLLTATQPALWLGLLGALLLLVDGGESPEAPAHTTLLIWGLLMFVGSQTASSGFPDRFERDLGVPLALLAAFALVSVIRSAARGASARGRESARGARSLALVAALPVVVLLACGAARNLQEAAGPAARDEDRAPPHRVVAAGEWLAANNTGGRILATPYFGPTSARGMLAMGGYSGMQAYTEKRIRKARDLPPSGAGPLWDALWAVDHPASERTRRLVRKNDVRYIVLNKHFPGAGWRAYRERDDLYRTAYENDAVIIFAPRYAG